MACPSVCKLVRRRSGFQSRRRTTCVIVIAILLTVAMQERANADSVWATLSLNSRLGWEVHRIIEHARVTGSDDELFGPTELERRVTRFGYGVGPEVTIGWRRWWGRFGVSHASHAFSTGGSSGNDYLRLDLGYGRTVAVFFGGRIVDVAYDDVDSTGLADYDLKVIVAGMKCDLRKGKSPWSIQIDGSVGAEGLDHLFDRVKAHELSALVEISVFAGYRPISRPYQIDFGYYFWSHSTPSRSYVPTSTVLFDKFWEEFYPIWHGVIVRTSYQFGW